MIFLVKVKVNLKSLIEFGQKLREGELDKSCIKGETYCIKNDPSTGYSIWETKSMEEFEKKFNPWRKFYENSEAVEVISPNEAMKLLFNKIQ